MGTDVKKIRLRFLAVLRCAKRSANVRWIAGIITKGIWLSLLAVSCTPHQIVTTENAAQSANPNRSLVAHDVSAASVNMDTQPVIAPHPKRANFEQDHKSRDAQHVADWVVDSGDNRGMPFVIVDKVDAKVFVFDADGRLRGAAPALVGLARGDDSIPGIGDRELSKVRPQERTTPAGRFVASLGYDLNGKDIVWVDYDLAVSLHRVVTNNPRERRLQRLASQKPLDHRISYGCINVPAKFFDSVVIPAFTGTYVIVYVLPDTRSYSEIFESYYDVDQRWGTGTTADLREGTGVGREAVGTQGRPPQGSDLKENLKASVEEHKNR